MTPDRRKEIAIRDLLVELRRREWIKIEDCPPDWKDGREVEGYDAREPTARCIIRWGKHNHVPLYGWIRPVELYGEEVDGFNPTHIRELPEPPSGG